MTKKQIKEIIKQRDELANDNRRLLDLTNGLRQENQKYESIVREIHEMIKRMPDRYILTNIVNILEQFGGV